jgi:hypothetical protein
MADVNTKSCDQCGKLKGENNHWWLIDANIAKKSMFVYPFDKTRKYSADQRYIHLVACGLECLNVLESKIKEGVNPLK